MSVYVGYLLLAGLQIPLFKKKDKLGQTYFNKKSYLILCCLELIVLAGIRGYTVGADTAVYLDAIDYYGKLPVSKLFPAKLVPPFDFEKGYFLLTKICVFLNFNKTVFLFVIATIIYVPIFMVINKYSKMPYISILCYFAFGMFSYSLGIFRQMIAISILLCGIRYVVERKFLKYALLVVLAMLFHMTAILGITIYFLYGIKWKRVIWALLGIEVIAIVFGRKFIELAFSLFPEYAGYASGLNEQQGGSYLMLILLNLILFASVFFRKKDEPYENLTICALIIAVCLQALGYSLVIFGRVVPYFSIFLIFAIPNIICNIGKKWRVPLSIMAMLCLAVFIYIQFNGNEYVTPYYTFFNAPKV